MSAESAESGERRNKAAAAAGSRLIGGRGRALLCSALQQSRIGFRETTSGRVVGAWDVGPTVVGVRILRVKLSQKLRNKNCDAN